MLVVCIELLKRGNISVAKDISRRMNITIKLILNFYYLFNIIFIKFVFYHFKFL